MEFNDVKTIAVIGAGNMGRGIALTLGLAGYQVHLNSNTELSLQRGMDFIKADLDRLVALEMEEPAPAQAALTKIPPPRPWKKGRGTPTWFSRRFTRTLT